MKVDYHTHTPLCRHAVGEPEEYVARAIAAGVDEIGFSDHSPMPPDYDPDWRMRREELTSYVSMVERARSKFPGRAIRLGLEGDFHPGTEEYQREVIAAHPWDYVIGSVHYVGDWAIDNQAQAHRFEGRDLDDVYAQYFDLVGRLARSRMFDIVGHIDVVKKFGHRPTSPIDRFARPALQEVKSAGMAIEINTSGLRRPCKELYPQRRILEIAFELGVPITLGSDAHRPDEVGAGFGEAIELARSVGYREIRRFAGRRSDSVAL